MGNCRNRTHGGVSIDAKLAAITHDLQARGEGVEEVRETSMAWVFLTRHHVYKMKKPIRRRILDFRSLARRRHACREEMRLNRRLASEVYLGLTRLTLADDGTLTLDGAGRTVEWLVRMRRLSAARFLDAVIGTGGPTAAEIEAVADRLTRFHAGCAPVTLTAEVYLGRYQDGVTGIRALLPTQAFTDTGSRFSRLCDLLESALSVGADGLTIRLERGRVVDGHGDLRPEHVWLGPPVMIIDCLEAAPAFRALDPFEEYATLAMECASLGADWIGPVFLDRAVRALNDDPGTQIIAFYTAFRATLRAGQALAHLLDPTPRTPEKWRPQANRYLAQAERAASILENAEAR